MSDRRPCETCDFIGPELPTLVADARAAHRALHGLANALLTPLDAWQIRVLDRVMQARADGLRFSLTLPRRRRGRP